MGVDCVVWIFPKQRIVRPTADQLSALANALRDGCWCPKPDASGQRSGFSELLPGNSVAGKKPTRTQGFSSDPFSPSWMEFYSEHELVLDWHVQNQREAGVQYLEDPKPFNALMSESRFRTEMVRHPVATDSLHISTELWPSVLWPKLAFSAM